MMQLEGFRGWVDRFAQKGGALLVLFLAGFVEASFLPISVDLLLIGMGVLSPKKSFKYALAAASGSVAGGFLGYFVGFYLFDTAGRYLLSFHGMMAKFNIILGLYRERGLWTLILAGFVPLPYIAFTYAAGFNHTLSIWTLALGSVIGRLLRFMPVGVLLYFFGSRAKDLIGRYFTIAAVASVILIIAGIIFFKWVV